MLDTLIKIGKYLSDGTGKWDDFLEKRENKLNKNKDRTSFILEMVFDIDSHQIIIDKNNIEEFNPNKSVREHLLFKTFSARNAKTYWAVLFDDLENLKISFFGKINKDSGERELPGTFRSEIDKKFPHLKGSAFYKALLSLEKLIDISDDIDKDKIIKSLGLSSREIVFVYASIKNSELGINEPTEISNIDGFEAYLEEKFLQKKNETNVGLCYASNEIRKDITNGATGGRDSLHGMFVVTYKNYLTNFSNKDVNKNFQISKEYKNYLKRGADFLKNNYSTYIAGKRHIIIPEFFSKTKVDYGYILDKIKDSADLLFNYKEIQKLDTYIKDETDAPYWINFVTTDIRAGQSFKTSNLIKDVSKLYFLKLIKILDELNKESNRQKYFINFYSFYRMIPVKSDSYSNDALNLFKDIFEQRQIDKNIVLKHFSQYMICQKSGQADNKGYHRAYSNIKIEQEFDFAIANGVFTYLFLLKFLKKLNLLKNNTMEEKNNQNQQTEQTSFNENIDDFFSKMNYTDQQKALFFLGRALDQVAYAQYEKNHKTKPVLNKINYNGMDVRDIMRLRVDLAEKGMQYSIVDKMEYNFSAFTNLFNAKEVEEKMTPVENVFYILSGYSFGLFNNKKTDNNN